MAVSTIFGGEVKRLSGLHVIEHGNVGIKQLNDFVKMWVVALNNKRNIVKTSIAFYFRSTNVIVLLLFSAIKPSQEKPRPLSLLFSIGAAHIE